MSTAVKFRGGTTAQHATFTGSAREITVDTDKKVAVIHDGTTAGGFPLAKESDVGMRKAATAGGTSDAITATFNPPFSSLAACAGYVLSIPLSAANATTTPTLSIDGLGAKTIVKGSNEALEAANMPGADFVGLFVYDASLDKFQLINPYIPTTAQPYVLGFKNRIINGRMDIAQRGTSFSAVTNTQYTLDRFAWNTVGAGVVTISQQAVSAYENFLRISVTTADTSIASTDLYGLYQPIEGYNIRDLIGQPFTFSFLVRSPKTGIHCVAFANAGPSVSDRSYVAEYTINSANTWEFKTVVVSGGLPTAGTWDWTNGVGLYVRWALAAGSTYQTTAGTWQTGNFFCTSNQVNVMDTAGNNFDVRLVQLAAGNGSDALVFDTRAYSQELALCQRYYETGNYDVYYYWTSAWGAVRSDQVSFAVPKRATPTIGGSFSGGGWTGTWSTSSITPTRFVFSNNATTNSGGFGSSAAWTASAEL